MDKNSHLKENENFLMPKECGIDINSKSNKFFLYSKSDKFKVEYNFHEDKDSVNLVFYSIPESKRIPGIY